MAGERVEIIDKVIERLKKLPAINPDIENGGDPISSFKNPFREVPPDQLPAFKVGLLRGKSARISNKIEYEHTDQLVVVYQKQGNVDSGLEDDLLAAMEAIADFLILDENDSGDPEALNSVVSDLVFTGFDTDFKAASVGTGAVVLTFDVVHHTTHVLQFGNLERVGYTIKPKDSTPDTPAVAEGVIDLPQT